MAMQLAQAARDASRALGYAADALSEAVEHADGTDRETALGVLALLYGAGCDCNRYVADYGTEGAVPHMLERQAGVAAFAVEATARLLTQTSNALIIGQVARAYELCEVAASVAVVGQLEGMAGA